jgi:haloacid dehalogenase superfamily, subfamily IA, variant 3 with third motif having DD or ED
MQNHTGALIFDFDGLILDTESPEVQVWDRLFTEAGGTFDHQAYLDTIGSWDNSSYEPGVFLARLMDHGATAQQLHERVRLEAAQMIAREAPLPGVESLITRAHAAGLRLAVGSSSPAAWVRGHLRRLGLIDYFATIVTFDDVSQSKPSPQIFLTVLARLGIEAKQALVLEDSHNGLLAAHRAGIRAVIVPNAVTAGQDFSLAAEVLDSLDALALERYFPL